MQVEFRSVYPRTVYPKMDDPKKDNAKADLGRCRRRDGLLGSYRDIRHDSRHGVRHRIHRVDDRAGKWALRTSHRLLATLDPVCRVVG